MNEPSTLLDSYDLKCLICSKSAQGFRFGIQSCRACAAFFRRTTVLNRKYKCVKRKGNCDLNSEEKLSCRYCRLKKCVDLGMTTENVRLEETAEIVISTSQSETTKRRIRDPPTIVDVSQIIKKSRNILEMYYLPDDDLYKHLNPLQKLAEVLKKQRAPQKTDVIFIESVNFLEIFECWEFQMSQTAEWLMNAQEFRELPNHEKLAFFKLVWAVWRRFERYSMSAEVFGQRSYDEKILLRSYDKAARLGKCSVDYSAITSFSSPRIAQLFGGKMLEYFDVIVKPFIDLKFNSIETSYMLAQICWNYAARRLQGQTMAASEKFLAGIGDNLHTFYQEEKIENYAIRITKMMKIVNSMLTIQLKQESTMDVAMVFDFFNVLVTDPDFFRV
ncbi:unnamed protein product [Caenorhabditis angaria]|uniref:Nuclear receptor domain-containing protein n=1 Tax=Caenorhabditis angaria TaxID=860376 RepID=A0A9P1IP69_9PELO|nr:unnamed protein product [Caenorhabditis angaria]